MTTRKHQPPPTKFSRSNTAQTKHIPTAIHVPPPTKFAQGNTAQAKPSPLAPHVPPPTRFAPQECAVQAKQTGLAHHVPPPTRFTLPVSATIQGKSVASPGRNIPPKRGVPQRYPSSTTIQRAAIDEDEDEEPVEDNVIRILARRQIHITPEEATRYASELISNPPNTLVPITGRHRALKMSSVGLISSVVWRPPANASHMRVSPFIGPQMDGDMMTMGPRPLIGGMTRQSAAIDAHMLAHIPERPSLATVMGGSAAKLSGISNSEWLHLQAHSLGGPDTPVNLVAGPHSLNTAMIPFETFVRGAVRKGDVVDYDITFFTEMEGSVPYVHHVEIQIKLKNGKKGTWTLEVNRFKRDEFINAHALADIEEEVKRFPEQ